MHLKLSTNGCLAITKNTTIDYYESAIGEMITKQRAFLELEKHGISDYDEFLNDVGDKLEYLATDVLDWLGY